MKNRLQRTPKDYDGTQVTTYRVSELLHHVLSHVGDTYKERPDLILATWPEIIGAQLAPMTQAISFRDGVLVIKVKNSTLHSLLTQHDKARLLTSYRKKFPHVDIKNIIFRIG